ncbi:MAG: hypothetical protein KI786_05745 [Mameliella sp.]|nr:hypothetical protein [Phaeodactylibacter sp.]
MSCNTNLLNQLGTSQGTIGSGTWHLGKPDTGLPDPCEDTTTFVFKDGYDDGNGNEVPFGTPPVVSGDSVDFTGFDPGIYYFTYRVADGSNTSCNACAVATVIVREGSEIAQNNNTDPSLCTSDGTPVNVYSSLFDITVTPVTPTSVSWSLTNVTGTLKSGASVTLGSDLVSDMGPFSWANGTPGVAEDLVVDPSYLDDQIDGAIVYELELTVDNSTPETPPGCDNCVATQTYTITVTPQPYAGDDVSITVCG